MLSHGWCFSLFILFMTISCCNGHHTNLVIVGGTGDLARKYLWSSTLKLFYQNTDGNSTFAFFAAARMPQKDGDNELNIIKENIQCESKNDHCEKMRPDFIAKLRYVQLKSPNQFKELCQNFSLAKTSSDETDRQIFYFSIPSSAYESVAKNVHDNCKHYKSITQIVLEKPFGSDGPSANKQASVIGKYFKEEEIYRVDHYLAKSVTKQILNFRQANAEILGDLMTWQYVDRVEIVMKETIGAKGRIDFYDQTGVIRDVMQNHLTELLALVAMELPVNCSNSSQIENQKMQLLKRVKQVGKNSVLTGQYSKYVDEAKEEIENISRSFRTPTFAAALLRIENPRWRGVPVIILSGKCMDERSSHIRIIFREHEFQVGKSPNTNGSLSQYPKQVVFQIGYGAIPSAGILVSKLLFSPTWPAGLEELSMTSKDSFVHGQSPGDFHYGVPAVEEQAYTTVLRDLYHFRRETFVTTSRVLLLWNIWDEAIAQLTPSIPRLYLEGETSVLNFRTENMALKYLKDKDAFSVEVVVDESLKVSAVPGKFRNSALVSGEIDSIVQKLAENIMASAIQALEQRDSFHIAFSGGRSPLLLFQKLSNYFPLFPWEQTHIWQVDERCVLQNDSQSNFLSIYENLLQHVHIPYLNIHPMPVNFAGKVCNNDNKGDHLYEAQIREVIPELKFDFIVLGMGNDGHTASLFPDTEHLNTKNKLVSLTKSRQYGRLDRMSLLLPALNNAREITILVSGKDKHDILDKISVIDSASSAYPITHISPSDGKLTWYIDNEAWMGS